MRPYLRPYGSLALTRLQLNRITHHLRRNNNDNNREALEELSRKELEVLQSLVPVDDADAGSAVLEIRAGTGGREAALFAADLFKMYQL